MNGQSKNREYFFWWFAYIAVIGGVLLYWKIEYGGGYYEGRDWLVVWNVLALLVSGLLGVIAFFLGRFTRDKRWQFRLLNAVFLSSFLLFTLWWHFPIRIRADGGGGLKVLTDGGSWTFECQGEAHLLNVSARVTLRSVPAPEREEYGLAFWVVELSVPSNNASDLLFEKIEITVQDKNGINLFHQSLSYDNRTIRLTPEHNYVDLGGAPADDPHVYPLTAFKPAKQLSMQLWAHCPPGDDT